MPSTTSSAAIPSTPLEKGVTYPPFAYALAGAGGGLATVVSLHPLDTLRTRLQSVSKQTKLAQSGEALRAFRGIFVNEGLRGLYKGVVPAAVGSVASWAFYFHWFHQAFGVTKPNMRNETSAHLVAGTCAGLMTTLCTNPIWVVKVRLQLQNGVKEGYKEYGGLLDATRSICREEGFRGLYKGIWPSIWLVSHGAIQFTLYETFKSRLKGGKEGNTSVRDSLLASTASKLVASVSTYPMQVARTRMQERFADGERYGRFTTAFRYVWKTEGIRGLYRGLSANIVRVTPQAAVTFVTYEQIMRLCAR